MSNKQIAKNRRDCGRCVELQNRLAAEVPKWLVVSGAFSGLNFVLSVNLRR
jgi:hypothetical protein